MKPRKRYESTIPPINAAAARYSINPDIVRAVIYTEKARGAFYGDVAEKLGLAHTIYPGNINTDWQKLIPGSDVYNPKDNIELTTKLISQIAKRLDDPSIENIYSLYNSLSHDRTYVKAETKTTPYFAKMAMEAKAWEKDNWSAPEFPRADDGKHEAALDHPSSFDNRLGSWGSFPANITPPRAPDRPDSFDDRFGNWGSAPAGDLGPNSPVLLRLQKYRRSEASKNAASSSAPDAAPPTPAFQPDAIYSPDGSFIGNFPGGSAAAGAVSPTANGIGSSSGPRSAVESNTLSQGVARLLAGAGGFIGNSLIAPAEAASPAGPLAPTPAMPNFAAAAPTAIPSGRTNLSGWNGRPTVDATGSSFPRASSFGTGAPAGSFATPFFPAAGGLPGLMAAALANGSNDPAPPQIGETNGSAGGKPVRYLARFVAGRPQGQPVDTAPQASFVNSDPTIDSDGQATFAGRFGNWTTPSAGATSAASPPQTARPLGISSGKPMPDWPVPPPLFDFGDDGDRQAPDRVSFPMLDDYIRYLNRAYGGLIEALRSGLRPTCSVNADRPHRHSIVHPENSDREDF